MAGYDIGASASTAISSQSGAAQSGTGEFNVTLGGRGGLSSVLPTTPAGQAWIVYAVIGIVAIAALALWFRSRK